MQGDRISKITIISKTIDFVSKKKYRFFNIIDFLEILLNIFYSDVEKMEIRHGMLTLFMLPIFPWSSEF